jgi:hypothetical protein
VSFIWLGVVCLELSVITGASVDLRAWRDDLVMGRVACRVCNIIASGGLEWGV